jgi:hypothetical protein
MIKMLLGGGFVIHFNDLEAFFVPQTETPVSEEEVEKLKKPEGLWYTDLPLPEETKNHPHPKKRTQQFRLKPCFSKRHVRR